MLLTVDGFGSLWPPRNSVIEGGGQEEEGSERTEDAVSCALPRNAVFVFVYEGRGLDFVEGDYESHHYIVSIDTVAWQAGTKSVGIPVRLRS